MTMNEPPMIRIAPRLDAERIDREADFAARVDSQALETLEKAASVISAGNVAGVAIVYVYDDGRVGWDVSSCGQTPALIGALEMAKHDTVVRAAEARDDE